MKVIHDKSSNMRFAITHNRVVGLDMRSIVCVEAEDLCFDSTVHFRVQTSTNFVMLSLTRDAARQLFQDTPWLLAIPPEKP